eukprot:TRINITY_DN27145_c0_g1_i1.p2 TRINITY_DN27145_c0_g1~~TRINITY_DN27145_c0_g1_i1.p2  ORF type:complete len:156 (+),score=35.15 TRINITY_DN27145_c0_g1_i1:28-495(+)
MNNKPEDPKENPTTTNTDFKSPSKTEEFKNTKGGINKRPPEESPNKLEKSETTKQGNKKPKVEIQDNTGPLFAPKRAEFDLLCKELSEKMSDKEQRHDLIQKIVFKLVEFLDLDEFGSITKAEHLKGFLDRLQLFKNAKLEVMAHFFVDRIEEPH